ncbi:MAG: hypothetical protein QXJ17_04380 [Nitrososphaeria archaeon]
MSSVEDYLSSIRDEIENTKEEMRDAEATVKSFVDFVTSDRLFKDYSRFYQLAYDTQKVAKVLVEKLLSFEMQIKKAEVQQPQVKPVEEVKEGGRPEEKKGILSRIRERLSVKRVKRKPHREPAVNSLIEYGRSTISRLDVIWKEYRNRYLLIAHQDVEPDMERELQSNLEFISYITNVCADIVTFVDAAYSMKIAELEEKYSQLMKALTVSETAQQPLPKE